MARRDTRQPADTPSGLVFDRPTQGGYFYCSAMAYPALEFSGFEEVEPGVYQRTYETIWPVSSKDRVKVS